MFMTNIPRRQIYEKMLEYEDSIIELQILILNEKNFEKYKSNLEKILPNLKKSYIEIKSLFVMFLENKKFEKDTGFEKEFKLLIDDEKKVNEILFNNETFKEEFKKSIKQIDEIFLKNEKINSKLELDKIYKIFDEFNHMIPNILTIRRDKIKYN